MKNEGYVPFSDYIHVTKFYILLMNGLRVPLKFPKMCKNMQNKKKAPQDSYSYENSKWDPSSEHKHMAKFHMLLIKYIRSYARNLWSARKDMPKIRKKVYRTSKAMKLRVKPP